MSTSYVCMNLKDEENKTVAKILVVAEELFSSTGYHAVSLRLLTEMAGVNLGAINYHFGNKEGLYRAIIKRRLQPLNQVRLGELVEAERAALGRPVALNLILRIYAGPLFNLGRKEGKGGHHFARILSRCMTEPLPFVESLLAEEFHPVTTRFAQAIRRHVPNLAPEDYLWRLSFVVGAMLHSLANLHRMKDLTRGICANDDHEAALSRFVQFSVVALTVPAFAGE